ncbi:hypothetical protein ColKHC_05583 [Colletotrichum higginsianum]|nr:hypothetical protein ColKHC_05583 [Colletotrichum higginsianum]
MAARPYRAASLVEIQAASSMGASTSLPLKRTVDQGDVCLRPSVLKNSFQARAASVALPLRCAAYATGVALLEVQVAEPPAVPGRLLGGAGAVVVAVVVPGLLEALGHVGAGVLDELGDDLEEAEDGREVRHGDEAVVVRVRGRGSEGAVGEVVEAGARDEAVLEAGDAGGRVGQLGAGLLPAGTAALPLEQPGGGERGPVGAEADGDGRVRGRDPAVGADLAVRVEDAVRLVGVEDLLDDLAGALVAAGQEVKDLAVLRRRDAGLLGAVAPVLDAVARAEALEVAEVVDVDLARVADEGLGEAVDVLAAGAEEVVPEEQVRRELRVVPGVAADVVAPLVAVRVVGVDEVAVVPEAVPLALLDLLLVEAEEEVEVLLDVGLDPGPRRRRRRRPVVAERLGAGEVLGLAVEHRRVVGVLRQVREQRAVRRRLEAVDEDLVGAGDAVGRVEAGLVVLVRDLERVELLGVRVLAEAVVVGPDVERGRGRAVDPDGDLALVLGGGVGDVDARGVALPEVAQADGEASLGGAAEVREPAGAGAARDVDPALAGLGALLEGEAVGGQLGEAEVAPGRDPVQARRDPLVPRGRVGELGALELGVADRGARVPAESRDALDGLAQEAAVDARDAHVAVVLLLALERHLEADAEARDEVLLGVAVVDDGVHDADRLRVVVQVEAQDERQPVGVATAAAAAVLHGVLPAHRHERAGDVCLMSACWPRSSAWSSTPDCEWSTSRPFWPMVLPEAVLISPTTALPDLGNVTASLPVSTLTASAESDTVMPDPEPDCCCRLAREKRVVELDDDEALTVYSSRMDSDSGIAWPVHLMEPSDQYAVTHVCSAPPPETVNSVELLKCLPRDHGRPKVVPAL